ncbi:ABC transporter permease [Kordia algicida OT-1]|uniref:ABC transporter, permease protein, putative n=1 Tax=Kordia algicida OT-1 TaxID=391587 RepID=A9DPJ0_9FLAO|nr:ABC transporter permease [Kordia algicida]EDP97446.1 ABC transporter, permease protein, putative [Kordia algicida OT-1]
MKFIFTRDTWQEIFGTIRKNKLRTAITVIGVFWGILLFIGLQGAAKGVENGFDMAFKDMATNSIFLWGQQTGIPYAGYNRNRSVRIELSDTYRIANQVEGVQFVAPRNAKGIFDGAPPLVVNKLKSGNYKVFGDYPVIDKVSKKKIRKGRFLNQKDIDEKRKICVIGERIQKELFEKDEDPIGQYIKISNIYFQVVGVYKKNNTDFFEGDNSVFIPFTTFKRVFNTGNRIGWMVIAGYPDEDIVAIEEKTKTLLKRRYDVHPDDERAFGAANLGEMFGKITGFVKGLKFTALIVGIATILAGVIAIGNILLITVKERTKEIGIRRALGAKPGEIRGQIILESVFLTLVAGIFGITIGGLLLSTLNGWTQSLEDFPFVNPTVSLEYIGMALGLMVVLGTLIGLIPAQRAVNVRPIEALREE